MDDTIFLTTNDPEFGDVECRKAGRDLYSVRNVILCRFRTGTKLWPEQARFIPFNPAIHRRRFAILATDPDGNEYIMAQQYRVLNGRQTAFFVGFDSDKVRDKWVSQHSGAGRRAGA